MRAISPVIPEANEPEKVIAENHDVYLPLPCIRREDGTVLTRWLLSDDERKQVSEQGYLYLAIITDGGKIQPVKLTVEIPDEFQNFQPLDQDWPSVIGGSNE
jgi:hypothetical protein